VGLVRETNEDAVYVGAEGRLLLCADGLGGLPYGEVASRLAIEHVVRALAPSVEAGTAREPGNWPALLRRAFLDAQEAVRLAGRVRGVPGGIGTTLIAAVTTARRAHICHVGDVRAYHWRRGALTRLTDDHSVVFDAVHAGTLTVEQARAHPRRNLVTQAVGLAEGIAPTTTTASIALGDLLLLCSDGFWETVSEAELSAMLGVEGAPGAVAESLLARALDAGGPDNVSVVVYRHPGAW
jgi:protein phosphatase